MRFVVNTSEGIFVEDRFTRTRRHERSIPEAHRIASRLNETMITHSTYETVDGFRPINPPLLVAQNQFVADVMGHA